MPAGLPYFAWIDPTETTLEPVHMRWDESIFSFALKQDEGDPASLTLVVRRPRNEAGNAIGLLGPGRKIWAWFALDCSPDLVKFRGRLVGVPTSIFEELVTLEFVARPADVVAQKEALANTLRVLPHYDEAVIDPNRRNDPDVVLEGYTKIWHFDRETHVVTISDEIDGEDGLVEFDGASEDGKVLYDGLALNLTSGPLARVDITAEYTWSQQATGNVDLTNYLTSHWPGASRQVIPVFQAADWPKRGAAIGDGWTVANSTASDLYDFTVGTETSSGTFIVEESQGGTARVQFSSSTQMTRDPYQVLLGIEVTTDSYNVQHDLDTDGNLSASASRSYAASSSVVGIQAIHYLSLLAGYEADRQCTERVSLSLLADVQHVLTDPEDGEALRIDDIRSVNLSSGEALSPIVDPRRRSYITTERGNRSLEHLIALARAHLMKRARVVEISFAPKLSRMPEVSLRKNASLVEPRVGEALGKVIGYSIALDGSDGRIACELRIGCAIGKGGLAEGAEGTPTYCTIDYTGHDYQQFTGRTVLVDAFGDTSVGYRPPSAAPNDDGLDFMSALTAEDVIETGLTVERGKLILAPGEMPDPDLPPYSTRAKFELISMKGEFTTNYDLQVTDLKIPMGYNLEAV